MAKQKKLEKAAAKALKRATEAVAEARAAAEKLDKKKAAKAKKRAKELQKELARLAGRPATPAAAAATPVDLTPPLPSVRDDEVQETVEFAGSVTTSAPHDPELDTLTVQALRDAARARGLRNVSRLTKGQLIERLSE